MDFAIGVGRNEPIVEIGAHARVAEESGFKYLSAVDMPFLSREVDSMMTLAAVNTDKILFLTPKIRKKNCCRS